MSDDSETMNQHEQTEAVKQLIENPETALRAEKRVTDSASPDAKHVDDPRTAARYVGDDHGVHKFQVVTTKLGGFPLGRDLLGTHTADHVTDWAKKNDPETVAVSDVEGFEATDYDGDVLAGARR